MIAGVFLYAEDRSKIQFNTDGLTLGGSIPHFFCCYLNRLGIFPKSTVKAQNKRSRIWIIRPLLAEFKSFSKLYRPHLKIKRIGQKKFH